MYLPSHFAQNDRPTLHALIRDHPLAALVTQGPDGPTADHVPLELDASVGEHGMLRGHVARANPVWRVAAGTPVTHLDYQSLTGTAALPEPVTGTVCCRWYTMRPGCMHW